MEIEIETDVDREVEDHTLYNLYTSIARILPIMGRASRGEAFSVAASRAREFDARARLINRN